VGHIQCGRYRNVKESQSIAQLVLKAVALAMGVAVVVLSILGTVPVQTSVILLGIGLFALALAFMQQD
jgi:Zn-dependent membrane protease YugP